MYASNKFLEIICQNTQDSYHYWIKWLDVYVFYFLSLFLARVGFCKLSLLYISIFNYPATDGFEFISKSVQEEKGDFVRGSAMTDHPLASL